MVMYLNMILFIFRENLPGYLQPREILWNYVLMYQILKKI